MIEPAMIDEIARFIFPNDRSSKNTVTTLGSNTNINSGLLNNMAATICDKFRSAWKRQVDLKIMWQLCGAAIDRRAGSFCQFMAVPLIPNRCQRRASVADHTRHRRANKGALRYFTQHSR